jgi:hypothetical protein
VALLPPRRYTAREYMARRDMRLPRTAQELADVIGRDAALRLIGQLPRCSPNGHSEVVMLYVPKELRPDHRLVKLIGWDRALALVQAFGGEVLLPANCAALYRGFRDRSILRLHGQGLPIALLVEWFDVGERHIRNLVRRENAQVGGALTQVDNPATRVDRTKPA